jgi:hypothetical protein
MIFLRICTQYLNDDAVNGKYPYTMLNDPVFLSSPLHFILKVVLCVATFPYSFPIITASETKFTI